MSIKDTAYMGLALDCPVIDAHTHIGRYQLNGWHQKNDSTDIDRVLEYNSRLGIDCIVTAPHELVAGKMEEANRIASEMHKRYQKKIYGYISVVPTCGMDAVKREIDTCAKDPAFVGMKFLPGFYHGALTVREYRYAMDFADEMGCPVLCHIWGDDPKHTDIDEALRQRHNMKFIMAHQGGGEVKYTRMSAEIMAEHPNVYMELCGSMDNRFAVEHIVDMVGEDRVIFGTDGINLDPKFELGKVAFSPLDDSVKRKIFAENYLNILRSSQLGKIELRALFIVVQIF